MWISVLVALVLLLSTGIYFAQSRAVIEREIGRRATELLEADRKTVADFLYHMQSVTFGLFHNPYLTMYLDSGEGKDEIENLFMNYCANIPEIQALRVVDSDGVIRIFIRECVNLTGEEGYEPIDISDKEFMQPAFELEEESIIFSNFERGHLPDATSFCPSMLRAVIPFMENGEKRGFLVVNFWGERIGAVIDKMRKEEGFSFIAEMNRKEPMRHGIFLFHRDKTYEFANQMEHNKRVISVYGEDVMHAFENNRNGLMKINNGKDYLAFTTISPYNDVRRQWKIAAVLNGDFIFRSLSGLKYNFIIVMAVSLFMSVITAFIFSARFLKPIGDIKYSLQQYGEGNLDHELEGDFTDELNDMADSIREMASSLKHHIEGMKESRRKMEIVDRLSSLSVLSAGISHELATPLNSILVACTLMEKEYGKSEELTAVRAQAERCVDILSAMKRLMTDSSAQDKTNVNLRETIENIMRFLEVDAKISLKAELNDVYITANETLISQVVLNILINAVDAVYPEGEVNIKLFCIDSSAVLEVSDTGRGMDEKEMENIFDPFFTTKSPDKGTGLGLSIVHRIVTEHGGRISVESEKERGTTIRVEFDESSSC